jgi:NitT/TauT family transport system substrate-binding protein
MISSKMLGFFPAARRSLALIGICCLASLFAVSCGRSERSAESTPIKLASFEWPGSYWIEVAIKKGWFVEAGLNIQRVDVGGKYFAALNLVATGGLDAMGFTQFDLVQHAAQGEDLVGIAALDYSEGAEALVARSGIHTLKDLKGKRLALHRGTYLEYLLSVLADREGVDLKDIELIDRSSEIGVDEFKRGLVDAVFVWEPWVSEAQEAGGTGIVFSTLDFPGLTYSVLTFRHEFVKAHPQQIAALMAVWHRAERYIHDHPEESCQIAAAAFEEPDADGIRKLMREDRVLDLADNRRAFSYAAGFESLHGSWRRMNDFLFDHGLVDRRVASPSHLDASYIRMLEQAP